MDMPSSVRTFVEAQPVARLATLDLTGRPHLVPICFTYLNNRLYSVVDEKPKRSVLLQRLRNIAENPVATLLCDVYSDNWEQLAWVMIRCQAEVLEDGAEHGEALSMLRTKYPQYASMALSERPVIAFTPERVTSWGVEA